MSFRCTCDREIVIREMVCFLQVSIQHSDRRRASIQVEDQAAFKLDTRHSINWKARDDDVHTLMMARMVTYMCVLLDEHYRQERRNTDRQSFQKQHPRESSSSPHVFKASTVNEAQCPE